MEEKKDRHGEAFEAYGILIDQSEGKIKQLQKDVDKLRQDCLVLAAEVDLLSIPQREKQQKKVAALEVEHKDKIRELRQEEARRCVLTTIQSRFVVASQENWRDLTALLDAFKTLDGH